MSTLGERIKKIRQDAGMTTQEFGDALGISRSSVSKLELGKNNPAERTLRVLAARFGVSRHWLDTGEGPAYKKKPDTADLVSRLSEQFRLSSIDRQILKAFLALDDSDRQAFLRFGEQLAQIRADDSLAAEPEALLSPPVIHSIDRTYYYGRPSAGGGTEVYDTHGTISVEDTPEAERADFVVQVSGHSMEPRYKDGDYVLVKRDVEIENGQIGIWLVDGQVYIKQKQPRRLHSLNPDYPDVELTESSEVHCFGRVIGKAKKVE